MRMKTGMPKLNDRMPFSHSYNFFFHQIAMGVGFACAMMTTTVAIQKMETMCQNLSGCM